MKFHHLLVLWLFAMSRCNPYLRKNLDSKLLPPLLLETFGDAILVEVDASYRRKLLEIQFLPHLLSSLCGEKKFLHNYMRKLITRRQSNKRITLPLSMIPFPPNYRLRCEKVLIDAPYRIDFLDLYHHYLQAGSCMHVSNLRSVLCHIVTSDGKFDAILTRDGDILMGRLRCDLGLKLTVLNWLEHFKSNPTVCMFHPTQQMLIIGQTNGNVDFYSFTDDSRSATPSFVMKLVASHRIEFQEGNCVKSITSNPSGRLFIVQYQISHTVLILMDAENNIVITPFIDEQVIQEIGMISSVAFIGLTRILTIHDNVYCVWNFDESDGSLTMVSQIEPIIRNECNLGRVMQIISNQSDDSSILLRTSESVLHVRLEVDSSRFSVVTEQSAYDQVCNGMGEGLEDYSIGLFNKMLILVDLSHNIVKFFLVKDTGMTLLFQKRIKKPTCWSYNPMTSIFSFYYDEDVNSTTFTRRGQFRV